MNVPDSVFCHDRLTTSPHRFPGSHPLSVASDGGAPRLRPVGFVDKLSGLYNA